MDDVTRILSEIEHGDPSAADRLLPLVYDELRRLAARRLSGEPPGQTLQATALVHEAYLRLVHAGGDGRWDGRGHFFAAAAEAMRRILIEAARRKKSAKEGGGLVRSLGDHDPACPERPEELLALDESLGRLDAADPGAAALVKLRFFAGLTNAEAAGCLGVSPRKADQLWAYARAWLREDLAGDEDA